MSIEYVVRPVSGHLDPGSIRAALTRIEAVDFRQVDTGRFLVWSLPRREDQDSNGEAVVELLDGAAYYAAHELVGPLEDGVLGGLVASLVGSVGPVLVNQP